MWAYLAKKAAKQQSSNNWEGEQTKSFWLNNILFANACEMNSLSISLSLFTKGALSRLWPGAAAAALWSSALRSVGYKLFHLPALCPLQPRQAAQLKINNRFGQCKLYELANGKSIKRIPLHSWTFYQICIYLDIGLKEHWKSVWVQVQAGIEAGKWHQLTCSYKFPI